MRPWVPLWLLTPLLLLVACSGSSAGSGAVGDDTSAAMTDVDAGPAGWLDAVPDRGGRPQEEDSWTPPVTVLICTPGATRCLDSSQPQVCADDGLSWEDGRVCPTGGVCNPATGGCEVACEPGDTFCSSPDSVYVCTDEGYYEEGDCPLDAPVCDSPGYCTACRPGAHICNDQGQLGACLASGFDWSFADCPDEGMCLNGGCFPCNTSCIDAHAEFGCVLGEGFVRQPCAEGETCHDGLGCVPCLGGSVRCLDNTQPQVCAEDHSAWLDETPCAANELCLDGCCVPCGEGDVACYDADTLILCRDGEENTYEDCEPGGVCAQGACVTGPCTAEVLVLIDRSGSMDPHWDAVRSSVHALFDAQPDVRFGIAGFVSSGWGLTSVDIPPVFPQDDTQIDHWFEANRPGGGTPLAPAVVQLAYRASEVWTLDMEGLNHFLVVLSDGAGTDCAAHNLPVPEPGTGDCLVDDLAAGAAYLRDTHGVLTLAVGFNYVGSPAQLLALVQNGGLSFEGYVVAGDEATLTTALSALFDDPKFCR